ncbi:MAG: PIN domain-containing protein [Caldilineaceae bacterium]|nr:PIN domain-containing protein [Caldilineaceae bacterium]
MKVVFDTNILIDYLGGNESAAAEIQRYTEPIISRITWLEILVGVGEKDEEAAIRSFLRGFTVHELDEVTAEIALNLRRERRLRLPDAIILATAHAHSCLLLTRNTRDFKTTWPEIYVPYEV